MLFDNAVSEVEKVSPNGSRRRSVARTSSTSGPASKEAGGRNGKNGKGRKPISRAALVEENIPLARYILHRISVHLPSHMDKDDLLGAGVLGLVDAASKFDPERNVKFQTYAVSRIRGAIIDDLREKDWLPRSTRDEVSKVKGAMLALRQKLDRDPIDAEIAQKLGMPKARVSRFLRVMREDGFRSLDQVRDSGEKSAEEPWAFVTGLEVPTPEESFELTEQKELLAEELKRLPGQERTVITLYYFEDLLLREISEVMGLSDSRICQLHHSALDRLRSTISEKLLDTVLVG